MKLWEMIPKKFWIRMLILIEILIVAILVGPYIYITKFACLSADDFCNYSNVTRFGDVNAFIAAYKYMLQYWNEWQGTYSGTFIYALLMKLFQKHGILAVHIEMAMVVVSFLSSILILVTNVIKRFKLRHEQQIILIGMAIITYWIMAFYDNENVSEAFYWYGGTAGYTIPFVCGIIAFAIAVDEDNSKLKLFMGCILALIAVGGALDLAVFFCGVTLLNSIYRFVSENNIKSFLVFFSSFLGTIVNIAAPGNYVRYSNMEKGYSLLEAIKDSFMMVLNRNISFIKDGFLPFLLVFGFAFAYIVANNSNSFSIFVFNPAITALVLFIGEMIIDFPVLYGSQGGFSPRNEFLSRNVAVMFLLFEMLCLLGSMIGRYRLDFKLNHGQWYLIGIVFVMLMGPIFSDYSRDNYFPYVIYNDLKNDELSRFDKGNDVIISAVQSQTTNEDVYVEVYEYSNIAYMKKMGVTDDSSNWINRAVAEVYNIRSLTVIYK